MKFHIERNSMCLTLKERKSVISETSPRYKKASKLQKSKILDEFVKLTGFNRHYATQVLRGNGKKVFLRSKGKRITVIGSVKAKRTRPKRPVVYDAKSLTKPLSKLWALSDFICSKRLVIFIRDNFEDLKDHPKLKLTKKQFKLLMTISAATIDRLLKGEKAKHRLKGTSSTKSGKLLKGQIPIRTFADWNEDKPGFFEIDLVSHDGGHAKGDYCFSLNVTDVKTSWTVPMAIKNKAQIWTVEALDKINKELLFPMLGIDSDNGSEFINNHLRKYCESQNITFTRGRPYKKNDGCYIEERNNTVVRRTVGYLRYEEESLATMNKLYKRIALLVNYFLPSVRLISKERIGSKIKKKYDKPQTPYQRLLKDDTINSQVKRNLKKAKKKLDLFSLYEEIKKLKIRLGKLAKKQ